MAGLLRTFAGTAGGGRWLLFAREQRGEMAAFALKALVSLAAGHHVLAELSVGERELAGQIDTLGLEVEPDAFAALLSRALDDRQCVTLAVGDGVDEGGGEAPAKVAVMITYKFSETISRKGCFALPVVAVDVPQAVVDLLTDMHEFPHRSVLSKQQLEDRKQRQMEQTAPVESTASAAIDAILKANACNMAVAGTGQGQAVEDEASRPNEQRLKRKQVPTGTIRRKTAKGAKLLKR